MQNKEFKDKLGDTIELCLDGVIEIRECGRSSTVLLTPKQFRKVGKALIQMADELDNAQ